MVSIFGEVIPIFDGGYYHKEAKKFNQVENVFRYEKKINEQKINMKWHKIVIISKYYRISCLEKIGNVTFNLQFMQMDRCYCHFNPFVKLNYAKVS